MSVENVNLFYPLIKNQRKITFGEENRDVTKRDLNVHGVHGVSPDPWIPYE